MTTTKSINRRRPQERLAELLFRGQLDDPTASRMLKALSSSAETENKPLVLNLRGAARFVGFSEQHFRRLVKEKVFVAVKFGDSSSPWFRVADLDRVVEQMARQSAQAA